MCYIQYSSLSHLYGNATVVGFCNETTPQTGNGTETTTEQQQPHPLQLAMAYRPPQPQLSLYMSHMSVLSSISIYSAMWVVKATHFFSIFFSIIDLCQIIGGFIGGSVALIVVVISIIVVSITSFIKRKAI